MILWQKNDSMVAKSDFMLYLSALKGRGGGFGWGGNR